MQEPDMLVSEDQNLGFLTDLGYTQIKFHLPSLKRTNKNAHSLLKSTSEAVLDFEERFFLYVNN
ncbi:MAG: hypothetical protein K940chlam9_01144 [Chlamydiae bacterium]|nr:hypothetical protein [Chlamydiota bacterium]